MASRTEHGLAGNDDELQRVVLVSSARGDGANPKTFAKALETAVRTKVWTRLDTFGGRTFGSFREFILAPRAAGGIGLSRDQLEHAAKLAGDDIWQLVRQQGFEEAQASPEHGEIGRGRVPDRDKALISNSSLGPTAENIVRRLKRDDPELAERVVRGEVTPNAAALEKGWEKPKIRVTSPEAVARRLREHMSAEDLAELVRLLS